MKLSVRNFMRLLNHDQYRQLEPLDGNHFYRIPFFACDCNSWIQPPLSHRHLNALKEALKNSRYIYIWGPSLGKRGLIWSILEISKITGMVAWPKASIKTGELDPLDLKNFPRNLKRRLIINLTVMTIGLTWMIGIAILLEFR